MGWDCTLHVVDEASLARFSARFLRGEHADGAFDAMLDADQMIEETIRLIAEDAERGARAVGELALMYVATETPHAYSRGFALSLWNDEVMGAPLPAALLGSVESAIPEVVRAHPAIAGRVPWMFDGNYCVGPFVAAHDVPALLAHVERVIDAMVPGERWPYLPLRKVLRVAAARGHAYWEGTDLAVSQANQDWLVSDAPEEVRVEPNPFKSPLVRPLAIRGTTCFLHEQWKLHGVDVATFPPTVTTHDAIQVVVAAFTPWNTLLVRIASDRSQSPYRFSYAEFRPIPHRRRWIFQPHRHGCARPRRSRSTCRSRSARRTAPQKVSCSCLRATARSRRTRRTSCAPVASWNASRRPRRPASQATSSVPPRRSVTARC